MLQAALSDFNAFIAEALPEPGLLPGLPRTTVVRVLLKVPEAFRCLLEDAPLPLLQGGDERGCGRGFMAGRLVEDGWSAGDANVANVPLGGISTQI